MGSGTESNTLAKAGKYTIASIEDIVVTEGHNPRHDPNPSERLIESIRAQNLIHPITVRRVSKTDRKLHIVDGERRFRAACAAGLTSVPVLNRGYMSDEEAFVEAVTANQDQEPLTPEEEYSACVRMVKSGMPKEEISKVLSISNNRVREYLRIEQKGSEKLKSAVKESTKKKRVDVRAASRIASLPREVQDVVVESVRGKSVKESIDVISKNKKTLLGGKSPATLKKTFTRPKYDSEIPTCQYSLAVDVSERCKVIEDEVVRRTRVMGTNIEFKSFLKMIAVLKGAKDPMTLFSGG